MLPALTWFPPRHEKKGFKDHFFVVIKLKNGNYAVMLFVSISSKDSF